MSHDLPSGTDSTEGRSFKLGLHLRGLRAQIVLWTLLPVTLILIGVAFTGVYSHEQAMRTLVRERDQALAAISATQVRERLDDRANRLERVAEEQAFHHRDEAEQQAILNQVGTMNDLFAGDLALLDESGTPLATGQNALAWIQDRHVAELVRGVMARQDVTLSPVFEATWGDEILLTGIPVRDETGSTYGALVAPVSFESLDLAAALSQAQIGEHGRVYLVDDQGEILASSPAGHARSSLSGHTGLDTALQDTAAGSVLCQAPDGERMTLAYAPIHPATAGWRVLIEQPWREVIGPVLRYSQFMPLVAALAVIVSLLTLYYGVQAIVRPLRELGQQAERVAWGDFEATDASVGGVKEIEDLRRTLDQMAKRIQSYQSGMHDYIAAITQGQEEERKRLARELHDDTAQSLIALRQQVEMAQKLLDSDPQRAAARLVDVQALLIETLESVRRFSRDLRPIYLEDLGFLPALEMLARPREGTRASSDQPPTEIHFQTSGIVRRLPPEFELAAYRIVQEAINNVNQHARASQAWVHVRFEPEHLSLTIQDDGQGFAVPDRPDELARQGHFGLMGIRERALLYGGQLTLRSAPGEGTEVQVQLPYPNP